MSPRGNKNGKAAAKKTPPPTLKRPLNSPVQNQTSTPKKAMKSMSEAATRENQATADTDSDTSFNSNTSQKSTNTEETATPATPKIPPIILLGSDWRKVAGKLVTTVPIDLLQAKAFGTESIKIQCADVQLFRIVQKYFTMTNTPFHTFSLPEERTLKIVIKGLLRSITETEVKEELESMGYEVTAVRQFGTPEKKLPIHQVNLKNIPKNKGIFNISSMFFMKISIERYKSNTPAQCYNCQRFGHSSLHCGFAPRCLKCTGPHRASECAKPKEEEPKCSNCDGNHTANYKKCPTILKEIESRKSTKPVAPKAPATASKNPPPPIHQAPTTATPHPGNSYATAVRTRPAINVQEIAEKLQKLLTTISTGEMDIKDALIATIMAIIPVILSG